MEKTELPALPHIPTSKICNQEECIAPSHQRIQQDLTRECSHSNCFHRFSKSTCLSTNNRRINVVKYGHNHLSKTSVTFCNFCQLFEAPTWFSVVSGENNNCYLRPFNCSQQFWPQVLPLLKSHIDESVDSRVWEGTVEMRYEGATSVSSSEVQKHIVSPMDFGFWGSSSSSRSWKHTFHNWSQRLCWKVKLRSQVETENFQTQRNKTCYGITGSG